MYRGFNLNLDESVDLSKYASIGRALIEKQKNLQTNAIGTYKKGDVIDASRLQRDWFGEVKANVFISHSHRDIGLVTNLAGYLQSIGLRPFVDSFVWGHAHDLLNAIDKQYCWIDEEKVYRYELRNQSTSYVHLMLASALNRMIDVCECVLFLNTPASVKPNDLIKENTQFTASPWIYAEIETSRNIRIVPPVRRMISNESFSKTKVEGMVKRADSLPEFNFELDVSHLATINKANFNDALTKKHVGTAFLDHLYDSFH